MPNTTAAQRSLKASLTQCLTTTFVNAPHDFSIGHRGACLQFPEHTAESYRAAIEMGAGIVECDVAVTSDGELVCRHSQCDLHTTTNILVTSLASRCSTPFAPADPVAGTSATASCCTSDITLAEFKTLCGKMDASVSTATTAAEYVGMEGTAAYRTDLYSDAYDGAVCPTVVSHAESVAIINAAGRKFTPELKTFTQGSLSITYDQVRQKLVNEYKAAGVEPARVWLQSFNEPDVMYWVTNEPAFGSQAVMLDGNYTYGGKMHHLQRLRTPYHCALWTLCSDRHATTSAPHRLHSHAALALPCHCGAFPRPPSCVRPQTPRACATSRPPSASSSRPMRRATASCRRPMCTRFRPPE